MEQDGENSGTILDTNIVLSGSDWTISGWILYRKPSEDRNMALLDLSNSGTPFNGFALYIRQLDGTIGFFSADAGGYVFSSTHAAQPNAWAFVGIRGTADGASGLVDAWLDDGSGIVGGWERISTGDTSQALPSSARHTVCRWIGDTDANPFHVICGSSADIRMWDRLVPEAQMITMYNARGTDEITQGLLGRWYHRAGLSVPVTLLGGWVDGLARGVTEPGNHRLLVFAAGHHEGSSGSQVIDVNTLTYGGQSMTRVITENNTTALFSNNIELWVLDEAGIAASVGTTFVVTWNNVANPDEQAFASAFYGNVEQVVHVGQIGAGITHLAFTHTTDPMLAGSGEYAVTAYSGSAGTAASVNGDHVIQSNQSVGGGAAPHRFVVTDLAGSGVQESTLTITNGATPVTRILNASAIIKSFTPPQTNRSVFVGKSVATVGSSLSLIVPVPTNVLDGDVLVASICYGGASATAPDGTTPAGWTLVANGDLPDAPSRPSLWVYRRTASAEPASYTFSNTVFSSSIAGIVVALRGVTTTEDVVSTLNTGTSSGPVSPAVTAGGDAICLRIMASDSLQIPGVKYDVSPGGVNVRDALEATGAGNGCSLSVADEMVAAGSTGTRTWALVGNDQWGSFTVTFLGGDGVEEHALRDSGPLGNHGDYLGEPKALASVLRI